MPISSTGSYYENFSIGRIYLVEKQDSIVIKVYQTWQGKQTAFKQGLSISFKEKKPKIYLFNLEMGVRNYTYKNLNSQIKEVLDLVAWRKSDLAKRKALIKQIIKFLRKKSFKVKTIEAFNIEVLKQWFPLISISDGRELSNIVSLLKYDYLRRGFRQEKVKDAVKIWFGKNPKGLVKRVGQLLQQARINELILSITCYDWNLDLLYRLMDLKITWNPFFDPDSVRLLFDSYEPRRIILLLENYQRNFLVGNMRMLKDTIEMFSDLHGRLDFYCPSAPRSFIEIHDALFPQYYGFENEAQEILQATTLPQQFPQLHDRRIEDFQLILPRLGRDLYDWGIELNNCLASYASKVLYENYTVVGVAKKNTIVYALGIQKDRLVQFSGLRNSKPPVKVKEAICRVLVEVGIKV